MDKDILETIRQIGEKLNDDPFDFSKTRAIVNKTGKTVKFHKKEKIWRLRFSTMF